MNASKIIHGHLDAHLAAAEKLRAQSGFIEELARRIIACLESGKKIMFFGNGGSAADAQHLAAEFVVRYRRNRPALRAIALSTDTSILTAGANDFGVESIFARQIEALADEGDVAIGISTSGGSPNVIAALAGGEGKALRDGRLHRQRSEQVLAACRTRLPRAVGGHRAHSGVPHYRRPHLVRAG